MKTSTHLLFALLFIYGQAQITDFFSYYSEISFSSAELTSGFKTSVYVENLASVYMVTSSALVSWSFQTTNYTKYEPGIIYMQSLEIILYNSVLGELWVASSEYDKGHIGRFSTSDLSFINGNGTNPQEISEMTNAVAGVTTSTYAYIINLHTLFRWKLSVTDLENNYELLTLTNSSLTLTTLQADSDTGYLYIGTKEGYVLVVQPASTLSSSTVTTYTVFETTSYNNIITSFIDVSHGNVYYATQGVSGNSPQLARQSLSTPTAIDTIYLDPSDYDVISSVLDETGGVAYIGMGQTPGRVSQITLPTFKLEGSYNLPDKVDPLQSVGFYYTPDKLLYFASSNSADGPYFVLVTPAEPCLSYCYSQGTCDYRYCNCTTGTSRTGAILYYAQPWCEYLSCDFDCYGHGTCDATSKCVCDADWGGFYCSELQCPNDCTSSLGRGECNYNSTGYPIGCTCEDGWTGSDCSTAVSQPVLSCDERYTCSDCVTNAECGWCDSHGSSGVCSFGNQIGPTITNDSDAAYQTCKSWFYSSCPNHGAYILNWILSVIIMMLWVVNVFSAIIQDSSPQETEKRTEWYRFTRSSKLHLLFYQIQFIGLCSLLGKELPSLLFDYTRWWYASLLATPLPWLTDSVDSTRTLLDLDQYYVYSLVEARRDIFMIVFIWFFIFLGASIVLFILSVFVGVVRGVTDIGKRYQGRFFYVIFRVIDLSYFGLVTFSAAQISSSSGGPWYGLAFLVYIVIGVVYPVSTIVWLNKVDSKKFFLDEVFKITWQPIYGLFDKGKKLKFAILTFLPRFLLGTFWGLAVGVPALQLVIALFVFIGHTIAVIQIDPYRDYLHKYITIFLNIVNAVTICVLFGALSDPDTHGYFAITVAFMLLQTIAIVGGLVFYIMVWLHMYEIYTPAQLCSSVKGGKSSD